VCTADGTGCVNTNPCSDPSYPRSCGNGYCCPASDRCEDVLIGDVIYPYCCLELPPEGCCSSTAALAQSLGSTTIPLSTRQSDPQCRRSTKVRAFDVLQVSAASTGGSAFDTAQHQYSIAFVLKGKKIRRGQEVVLKVPVIPEDSNASTLSVMIPPFLLNKASHGKAEVFLVTDGLMSDTCISTVRIAKLPKSASRLLGLVTLSWLRANQTLYSTARTSLATAAAAPFVNPEILGDVDTAIAKVGELIPSFDLGKGARGNPLAKVAKQSDRLLTGLLTACQRVGDAGFASACTAWLQALSAAGDSDDAALQAAEAAYANALLNASGASAQSIAKFTVATASVTSAGVGASAVLAAAAAAVPAAIDAQAAANAICGATVAAANVITGVAAVAAGAAATPGAGVASYGQTLLRGDAHVAASQRTNYGAANPATAKLCGCRQPPITVVIDTCITVILTCDHIRRVAPRFCLPTGEAQPAPNFTTTTTLPGQCGNGVLDPGEECDEFIQKGDSVFRPQGTICGKDETCQFCRCVGTGDVGVTLSWATEDDLDLHVTDPSGEEIYYGHRTSASGGVLDVDSNAGCANPQSLPVENIFWGTGAAPQGTYTVRVDYWCGSGDVDFSVRTLVDGVETFFDGILSTPDQCGACSTCGTCSLITSFTR
jgi:hypothetical protein